MNLSVDFPRDPKIGYLSYRHNQPIEINGEIWPSIYRYILSKTIPGYSNKIRTFPSETSIRRMIKPRIKTEVRPDGHVIKNKILGCEVISINLGLELEAAFEAKFEPIIEEFLKTYPFPFVSKTDPEYASALTKYRNRKYSEKIRSEKSKIDLTTDLPNLDGVNRLFKIMEKYVKKLKKIEKVKKDHLGLYEDALWNLIPRGKAEKILASVKIDYVMRNLTNQREAIAMCYSYFGKKFPKEITTAFFKKVADTTWATFRWQVFSGMKYNLNLSSKDIKLKPVPRPYRKKETQAGHLKTLVVRSEEYAKLFGQCEDYEALVEAYEKMEPMKRELEIEKLLAEYDQKKKKEEKEITKPEIISKEAPESTESSELSESTHQPQSKESEPSESNSFESKGEGEVPMDDLEDDESVSSLDSPSNDSAGDLSELSERSQSE